MLPALVVLVAALAAVAPPAAAAEAAEAAAAAARGVNPVGPVDERATLSYRAERPSIADRVERARETREARPALRDPLAEVLLSGNAPMGDAYVRIAAERLKSEIEHKSVRWIGTDTRRGREEVGDLVAYCTRLFASRGTDRNCVVQCHPPVSCGEQAARICQPLYGKGNGDPYTLCVDHEEGFCKEHGAFGGEQYPSFKARGETNSQRVESVTDYCGNLFQMRGVRLSCLRTCTLFQMRHSRPDDYYRWKVRARRRFEATHSVGDKMRDPTEPATVEGAAWTQCEKRARTLCRFIRRDYWRECYERNKVKCASNIGLWSDVLPH